MKLIVSILILTLFAFALCDTAKHETQEMMQAQNAEFDQDVSILATVSQIKSKSAPRSLAAADPETDVMRTLYQAYIWVPIILVVVLFYSVMAIFYMDLNKEQDTLIYAKFITSYK